MSKKGLFIVFEGGEGAGKSTLAKAISIRLEGLDRPFIVVREPGGTTVAEGIRELLKKRLNPWGEALAFLVARADLITRVIRPSLNRGLVVLCDRFSPSTFAYQGYGRNLDLELLKQIDFVVREGVEPDLVIFCDVPIAEGLARKAGESEPVITGSEKEEFHQRVYLGYQALMSNESDQKWVRVDATQSIEDLAIEAWTVIEPLLKE
jgi:dTMP kinase